MQKLRFTPLGTATPASSRRGDVLTYLASVLGFDRYSTVVTMPEDRNYYFPQTAAKESVPYRAAAFLIKFGVSARPQEIDRVDMNAAMPREELYGLLGSWIRKHSVISDADRQNPQRRRPRRHAEDRREADAVHAAANLPIFRKIGDRYQEYSSAPVTIGDRATITSDVSKTPVALVINAYLDGASFDRSSNFASWTRSFRADELVTSINKRNPIQQLSGHSSAHRRRLAAHRGDGSHRRERPHVRPARPSDPLVAQRARQSLRLRKNAGRRRHGPLHVLRQRVGPRHRLLPGRRVRNGHRRLDGATDPDALLHGDRDCSDEVRRINGSHPTPAPPAPPRRVDPASSPDSTPARPRGRRRRDGG